jgi:hypothetical protein
LARLETGHTPSRKHPEYWDGEIPWIGIKDATSNHGLRISDTYQHATQLGIDNSSARVLPANTVCLSRTASVALSNIFTPILLQMAYLGGAEEMIFNYKWFMKGVYTYRGSLTNAYLARKFMMSHKELQLLLAARY